MEDDEQKPPETATNKASRILVLAILGIIVGLFVLFLVLRPRGADAQTPAKTAHLQKTCQAPTPVQIPPSPSFHTR